MTCFYCGTELPAGAMFCGECGRPVNTKGGRSAKAAKPSAADAVAAPSEQPVASGPEPEEPVASEEPVPDVHGVVAHAVGAADGDGRGVGQRFSNQVTTSSASRSYGSREVSSSRVASSS